MIKHIIVRDLLNTRFVLFRRVTGTVEIRYIEAGDGNRVDRLLLYNPELDRGSGTIISPEFTTYSAVADYLASLSPAKLAPSASSPVPSEVCCLDQARSAQDVSSECPPTTTLPRLSEIGA